MKQCHIFTDDKIGNINPAKGLAERLTASLSLKITHDILKKTTWLDFIPFLLVKAFPDLIPRFLEQNLPSDFFEKDNFPEIIIGNGHNSIKFCALLRIFAQKKNFPAYFIQLQNPRISAKYFDIVIPPQHDTIRGENIYPTIGSLNHITDEHIAMAHIPYEMLQLKDPVCAVFLGGRNKRYKFDDEDAERLGADLKKFMVHNKCSLAITASRRTTKKQIKIIQNIIGQNNVFFWDGKSDNPYFAFLRYAKMAIITSDSANMLSEVATAGLPILIYPLTGKPGKFKYLYNALKKRDLAQDFTLMPKRCFPAKLRETERIANLCTSQINDFFKD